MEVFVRNVPSQGSQPGFKEFLRPVLSDLSIQDVDCQKNRNKKYASLTFLKDSDAKRFLARYGEQNNSSLPTNIRPAQPLKWMNQRLYFVKSIKGAQPHLLGVLAKEAMDRSAQLENTTTTLARGGATRAAPSILPSSFKTRSLSCGLWDYKDNSNLAFVPQVTWNIPGDAKFIERSMILRLENKMRVDFYYEGTLNILTDSGTTPSFIFSMKEPPRFYETIVNPVEDLLALLSISGPKNPKLNQKNRHRLPYLDTRHKQIAGHCLVWRIELAEISKVRNRIHDLKKAHGMPSTVYQHTPIMSWAQTYAESSLVLRQTLASNDCDLPFTLKFQVAKLLQNNYLKPSSLLSLLPEIKKIATRSTEHMTATILKRFTYQIDFPGPDVEADSFKVGALRKMLTDTEKQLTQFGDMLLLEDLATAPGQPSIHRVKVTPAGYYLYGPAPECNNRVLRKFPDHHDYFLRVNFCEEDGRPIRFSYKVSNDRILSIVKHDDGSFFGRFKGVLEEGIVIAGRKFSQLGWSHSSLRSHCCWFVAPFIHKNELITAAHIIDNLGDFTIFTSPARRAARIGQSFSDTPTTVQIDHQTVCINEDIKRNGRVFSDGVGTFSEEVLVKIWDSFPNKSGLKPTCYQIRCAGAKGMLSLDTRLEGEQLILRDSMVKFEGTDKHSLELCGGAWKPLPLFLNRQLIKIMEDMGVDESFFLKNQSREIERLRSITLSPLNASTFLKRQTVGEAIDLPWFINELSSIGLDFRDDPHLSSSLELTILIELRTLKHKARIPVEKGWHLHGIMDETGILEEGQVYCVVNVDGISQSIVGKDIIISRAPAHHPGDVQLVECVKIPDDSPLLNLHNCIIFSQNGQRDLPSQLSGGDLDGDLYYIIWDDDARPKQTFSPADYPRVDPLDIGRPVKAEDMNNFFLDFMASDQLGRLSTSHEILADQSDYGTLDPKCLIVAGMCSTAVDYSKTGIPVDMSIFPRPPPWRPDFMAPGPHVQIEKRDQISFEPPPRRDPKDDNDEDEEFTRFRYYESTKILGKLYRAIDERKIFEEIQDRSERSSQHQSSLINDVWKYVQNQCQLILWEHKIEWARNLRDEYEQCIRSIMIEYSEHPHRSLTELEVFVGNILGKTGSQTKQQRELSTSMKERSDMDTRNIVNCIRRDDIDSLEHSTEALERSMACLAVSLEESPHSSSREKIVGFQILAASICLKEVRRPFLEYQDY